MKNRVSIWGALFFCALSVLSAAAQTTTPQFQKGKNLLKLRGKEQRVFFYPGQGDGPHHKVLFAPGDGGHRGFAILIARKLAELGYDAYAIDTKHYLSSFTNQTHLTPSDVMGDFHQLAEWIRGDSDAKVTLAGWSTGAGLAALAAADDNKALYDGLIAVSLGKTNILGWRWRDNFSYLTRKTPKEPTFQTADYMPKVAPLPVFIIQSSGDEWIPTNDAKELFITTKKPKRFTLIHANNHSFQNNRDGFFDALRQGTQWIEARPGPTEEVDSSRRRTETLNLIDAPISG